MIFFKILVLSKRINYGGVAQLARALGSYPIGREFESPSRYQIDSKLEIFEFFIILNDKYMKY